MRKLVEFLGVVMAALAVLGAFLCDASAQGTTGTSVIIGLRLEGDAEALTPIRSCLAERLSQMPDVKMATAPTDSVRFIVDLVAAKTAKDKASASVVVAETFPMEQFRPRMKEGENTNALLTSIRYYTLLRLHELIADSTYDNICSAITGDIANKVLSQEYTERND